MKAFLLLALIYVGAFLIAIQGSSQGSVEAAEQVRGGAQTKKMDPAKQTEIRSLMELLGARDSIQEAANRSTEQIRASLVATVPDNERGQQFVKSFIADYQKKYHANGVNERLVGIYDKHFTASEIKELVQFYSSPLGQKWAAETPNINAEVLAADREEGTRVAQEVLRDLNHQFPTIEAQAGTRETEPVSLRVRHQQTVAGQTQASAVQP